jgi:protein-tyrosine phosphatase/membrane-associated phospholipid phosphatase
MTLAPAETATRTSCRADEPLTVRQRLPRAIFWSVLTSVAFVVVYSATNAHAHALVRQGAKLPTVAFDFERHIPIVPAFIVPYMSIDAFFALSPLLCRTRRQMDRHAQRLLLATAVAGLFFWFVPLQLAWPRPQVEGVFKPVCDFLHGFDQPYNLAPSLHIALRSLLWVVYVRETGGLLQLFIKIWFVAIGVSTLLVGQHHLVDVLSGHLLAMWCLHLVPDRLPRVDPGLRRFDIAFLHALGGAACVAVGVAVGWKGVAFAWPAYAMLIVASGYAGAGPAVFRKIDGRLLRSSRWILGPFLVGAWLNWRLRRTREPMAEVTPTLLVGRKLGRDEIGVLRERGVTHVIDLTAEFSTPVAADAGAYTNVPVLDLIPPSPAQLTRAADAYVAERDRGGRVMVHCGLGYSRGPCAAAACLLASGEANSVDDAIAKVSAVRRSILSARHIESLRQFHACR